MGAEVNFFFHNRMRLYMKKDVSTDCQIIYVIVHDRCEYQGRYDYLVGKFKAASISEFVDGLRQSSKTLPLYGLKAAILNCVLSTESSSILPQSFFSVDA